ncbi:MAG TPA: YicC/YloC family endoribonuclease [Bdellovibrionales bacterium]|nr:YicC/YloC family endoribonuclease [Bdellovibrionales bacterium]
MKSMTGFGRSSTRAKTAKSSSNGTPEINVSVRTVNGRFLEVRTHMPREFAALETDFKATISKYFSRGTIDLFINRKASTANAKVSVNSDLAKEWLKGVRSLAKELKLAKEPSLETILQIPELVTFDQDAEPNEAEKKLVKKLVEEAVEACDAERAREGKSLQAELAKLCKQLEALVEQMQTLKTEANRELEKRYRDRLKDGFAKLGLGGDIDQQRIAQEMVIQLDRSDIGEELVRLTEHLRAYKVLIAGQDAQGKKLDFYAQELLREVNTIGSKSQITKLTALVVDAKTIVERIREQVQNAE